MDNSYDEDLSDNPFFSELKNEYSEIFQYCISEGWIICVPRIGSLASHIFVLQDFLGHILVQNDELPETHYLTLTEKPVRVLNKVITLENEGIPFQSHILFEETFYVEGFNKYKVWCIESLLEPSIIKDGRAPGTYQSVNSLRECIDFLWTQSGSQDVLESIKVLVKEFLKRNKFENANLTKQKDLIAALYTNCLQKAFRHKRLKEKCFKCKYMMQSLKLSVETFLQHLIYGNMMNGICAHTAYNDSYFNKVIRNLSDIQLRDLDIRKDLYETVPAAKKCLAKIQHCTTVLEKVVCIKNTINAINQQKTTKAIAVESLLTADDLLPVLVFLVIKCSLPNWIAQITYLKEFRYSSSSPVDADETSFLITTLEAVIEHIKSGLLSTCPYPESHIYYEDSTMDDRSLSFKQHSNQSLTESAGDMVENKDRVTVTNLFEQIRFGNYDEVKLILEQNNKSLIKSDSDINTDTITSHCLRDRFDSSVSLDEVLHEDDDTPIELCHPLCYCRKCHRIVSKSALRTTPTVESRDSHGFTPLHISSINGKTQIADLIIAAGGDVNATDYNGYTPLHYAALRGHQNALLLLLHSGSELNLANNDGNTPLHLSSNNGHESCVKALVYFSEHSRNMLDLNKRNEFGNSALHFASKWGYESIVRLLIDYGADPYIVNMKGKTAYDYANNLHIENALKVKLPNLQEYIVINLCSDNNANNVEETLENTSHQQNRRNTVEALNIRKTTKKFEPIRPQTTEEIRNVERLIRSIVHGDTKLACFYMSLNIELYNESKEKPSIQCHPLCICKNCSGGDQILCYIDRVNNLNMCNASGYTPLHVAVKHDRFQLCRILLKNGAMPNLKNNNSQTALHLAAQFGRYEISEILISFNADVNMVDVMGNTPLHIACSVGCASVVRLLLSNGADTGLMNTNGKTALEEAKDKIYLTIIGMLERQNSN